MGPRRPPRPRSRRARRVRGRARPVLHARAGDAARTAASRRRSSTTRTRACSTGTSPRPRSRRRSTTPTARRSATRRSPSAPRIPSCRRPTRATSGPAATTPPRASPSAPRAPTSFTVDRHETGSVLGHGRARARVLDGPRGRDLPPSRRAVPRRRARPRRRAAPLVEPFSGDWYTQAKKETTTAIEEPIRVERRLGLELDLRPRAVTEQVVAYQREGDPRQCDARRSSRSTCRRRPSRRRRSGTCPTPEQLDGLERDAEAPRLAPRGRALDDRAPAALGDVRPLGHRRPLDERPLQDTGAPTVFVYDGHPGGVGISERGFEAFEGWVADTATDARRLPVRARLPVVRAVAEVRQPQRARSTRAGRSTLLRRMLDA